MNAEMLQLECCYKLSVLNVITDSIVRANICKRSDAYKNLIPAKFNDHISDTSWSRNVEDFLDY